MAINDNGVVVGKVFVDLPIPQVPSTGAHTWTLDVNAGPFVFLWDPSPFSRGTVPWDINNQGMVTGTYLDASAPISGLYMTAYRWVNGQRIPLDPLPTVPGAGMFHVGIGINEQGVIVGVSEPSLAGGEPPGAAMWIGTERIWLDPPSLPFGHHLIEAHSINERGQIVGFGDREGGPLAEEAYLLEKGRVTWLNDIMPAGSGFVSLVRAAAISDEGWIVGTGVTSTDPHGVGFILKPVGGCYVNCDRSTAAPVLSVDDFVCFQGRFAAGAAYADCDRNGTLNVNDFVCFQQAFAGGCP